MKIGKDNGIWKIKKMIINMKIKKIKENIGIKINRKIIEFTHRYIFREEGKYIIEYRFKII